MKALRYVQNIFVLAITAITTLALLYAAGVSVPDLYHDYLSTKVSSNVFALQNGRSQPLGTAFLVDYDSKKYMITAGHICERAQYMDIFIQNKQDKIQTSILKIDDKSDLCLLDTISGDGLQLTEKVYKHQKLGMIGYGFNEAKSLRQGTLIAIRKFNTFLFPVLYDYQKLECEDQKGEVIYKTRGLEVLYFCIKKEEKISTTIIGGPGSSGSPVFDRWGNVIGVMATYNSKNLSVFAVPSKNVINLIKQHEEKE